MMSDQINELAAALAKAQGAMKNAPLNRQNPHFKSRYADLAAIRDAVVPALAAEGIAVVQTIEPDGLVTRLVHASGQWIASHHPLPHADKPQTFGSALTYARRYSLAAIVGIAAEEDDDGQAAQEAPPRPPQRQAPRPAPSKPAAPTKAEVDAANVGRELAEAIRRMPDADALRDWWTQEAERIHSLPEAFRARIAQRYDERMEQFEPLDEPGAHESDEGRFLMAGE